MLVLTLFTVISVLFNSTLGLKYSFDVDFTQKFIKKHCDSKSDWSLINLQSIGVSEQDGNVYGILATRDSCVTSFPITFEIGGTLEVHVYMQVSSENSGITVILSEEFSDSSLASYIYNGAKSDILPGWLTLRIPIEINFVGHISFLGNTKDHELIIIDYFKYLSSAQATIIKNNGDGINLLQTVGGQQEYSYLSYSEDQSSIIKAGRMNDEAETQSPNENSSTASTAEVDTDTSDTATTVSTTDSSTTVSTTDSEYYGTTDSSTTVSTTDSEYYGTTDSSITVSTTDSSTTDTNGGITESVGITESGNERETTNTETIDTEIPTTTEATSPVLPPEESVTESDDTFWNVATITALAAACLIVIILLSVGFYHLGKMRSNPLVLDNPDVEYPRTVIIPRVKELRR